ncbi:MAG: sel1 repeat family protein [Lachnospiraceae bacterium]|nr:sel1 repeat family protein [Lachnospiraceae bacterium]
MTWQNNSLSLPDGTAMVCRDTVTKLTNGIIFCFEAPSSDPDSSKIPEIAARFSRRFIALVRVGWPESLPAGDGTVNAENTAFVQSMLETLKEHYHRFEPWFLCYAEGFAAQLIFACFKEYGPAVLDYSLIGTGWDEIIREMNAFPCTVIASTLKNTWQFNHYGVIYPYADGAWDFLQNAFFSLKKRVWTNKFNEAVDSPPWADYSPLERMEVLTALALEGCPEACIELQRSYQYIAEESDGELSWEEDSLLEMYDFAAAALAADWPEEWPPNLFWKAAAARFGHPGARMALADDLTGSSLLPELREILIRNLETESEAGFSYASVLLGLLAEPGFPVFPDRQDPAEAAAFYMHAAELGDPEGNYRLGKLIEYGPAVQEIVAKELYAWDPSGSGADPSDPLAESSDPFAESSDPLADSSDHFADSSDLFAGLSENDPMPFYEKAAGAGYVPAMVRLVCHLETVPENERDLSRIESLYDEITSTEEIGWCLARLGLCREACGDMGGAVEAYECVLYNSPIENDSLCDDWSYSFGIDRFYGSVMPENEILLTAYPYYPAEKSLSEQFVSLRLGRLLMDDPDLSSDTSPTECFEQVVEGILNDYEKYRAASSDAAFIVTDPDVREILYQYGLCCMKGIQCKPDTKKGFLCMELAALSGEERAAEYASFLKEAVQFRKSCSETQPFADKAMRAREAYFRLRLLSIMGLSEDIFTDFKEKGILYAADEDLSAPVPFPGDEPGDYEKLILKEIALMEHMHSATVYFVHISGGITYGMYTVRVSLFYVSSEISEWEWDREQLMNREPFVYAFDLRSSEEDYCAEIGPVGFSIEDGQMRRLW